MKKLIGEKKLTSVIDIVDDVEVVLDCGAVCRGLSGGQNEQQQERDRPQARANQALSHGPSEGSGQHAESDTGHCTTQSSCMKVSTMLVFYSVICILCSLIQIKILTTLKVILRVRSGRNCTFCALVTVIKTFLTK